MRSIRLLVLTAAIAFGSASVASAQYVYGPPPVYVAPQPIVPIVNYSYYPPGPVYVPPTYAPPTYAPPVYVPPTTAYYGPAPTVAYYPPSYGVAAQTTTYGGLGIFRPRQVTTQYYYYPR